MISSKNGWLWCLVLLTVACVPQRKYLETTAKLNAYEAENANLKARAETAETKLNEFDNKYALIERKANALASDTAVLGSSLRILRSQYDKINALNNELLQKTNSILSGSEQEQAVLMAELGTARQALQAKEDALKELETALALREGELEDREAKLA